MINNPGLMGPLVRNPAEMTRIVDFNDIEALEKALAPGDIACVITEPVMTNVGIINPQKGLPRSAPRAHAQYGTLLLIDETHSMLRRAARVTGEMNLDPDIFVAGKFIAGGYPARSSVSTRRFPSGWRSANPGTSFSVSAERFPATRRPWPESGPRSSTPSTTRTSSV